MVRTLITEPLTAAAFAPFGEVIESAGRDYVMINQGSTRRYHRLAEVQTDELGTTVISLFRASRLTYPLRIGMLERHPLGSQAFMPLRGNDYLLVVAPGGSDHVDPAGVRAFHASGLQGVNYHRGVWHHPLLALHEGDEFLVIDRAGPGHNCEEYYFDETVALELVLPA